MLWRRWVDGLLGRIGSTRCSSDNAVSYRFLIGAPDEI